MFFQLPPNVIFSSLGVNETLVFSAHSYQDLIDWLGTLDIKVEKNSSGYSILNRFDDDTLTYNVPRIIGYLFHQDLGRTLGDYTLEVKADYFFQS